MKNCHIMIVCFTVLDVKIMIVITADIDFEYVNLLLIVYQVFAKFLLLNLDFENIVFNSCFR